MLRQNQVAAIMPLVEMLNDRDIRLVTYTETGLGELTIAANTQLDAIPQDNIQDILVSTTGSQTVPADEHGELPPLVLGSDHSRIKSALVSTLAAGVKSVIKNAHGIILPAIRTARDGIDKRIGETASVLAITPETKVFSYNDIWSSVTVDGIATRHESTPATIIPAGLQLPELTDEQVDALASAGGTELGSFLAEYKQTHNVKQLYDAWFRGIVYENPYANVVNDIPGGRSVEGIKSNINHLIEFVDAPIVAYIIANNLLDNPPVGTVASSSDQYNADVSAALNHFGKIIGLLYTQRDMNTRSGLLVMQYPNTQRWVTDGIRGELILNADTYRGYLEGENKGDIETILGSMFSENASNNANTILSLAGQYKNVWTNTLSTFKMTETARTRSAKLAALTDVVTDHIRGISDEDWAGMHQDVSKGSVINQFVSWLSKDVALPTTSVEMDEVLITAFCDIIYPQCNAGEFIRRMNNYPNQNLEPNVIATHVVMEMLIAGMLHGVSYE